jgi:4-diphosphocytidyl-2-C-methyl-D-erythritol kinase
MLEKASFCKVNLLLNILGKRPDGFHELETILQPVSVFDHLTFDRVGDTVEMTCSDSRLPINSRNLVVRAADLFLDAAEVPANEGVRIHLQKNIPLAAGLGGGSGNAAVTLLAMNELFGNPLPPPRLVELAATLGSDIPFFLQNKPALATGRGEIIQPLEYFPALRDTYMLLVHPGFGISTAWSYEQLARFPATLNGKPGRAERLISLLQTDVTAAGREFYNSLESPALRKYPLLDLFQEFFRKNGVLATLMTGSGSTTFALTRTCGEVEQVLENFKANFGPHLWTAIVKTNDG